MLDINTMTNKFKRHELTALVNNSSVKIFNFSEPDSWNWSQKWILTPGRLVIVGSCGDAIYSFGDKIMSLEALAVGSIASFSSKCVADKDGKAQKEYDPAHAEWIMKTLAVDHVYEYRIHEDIEGWPNMSLKEKLDLVWDKILTINTAWEVDCKKETFFLKDNRYQATEFMMAQPWLFGEDGWDHPLAKRTVTPYFHLAALRAAHSKYENWASAVQMETVIG